MNTPLMPDEIRQTVLRLLGEIAPETDLDDLEARCQLPDELDIDSMDFLNFVIMIHKTFGVEIPEADYPKYGTLMAASSSCRTSE